MVQPLQGIVFLSIKKCVFIAFQAVRCQNILYTNQNAL